MSFSSKSLQVAAMKADGNRRGCQECLLNPCVMTDKQKDKAAEDYADRLAELRPTIFPDIAEAFKDGADFALSHQWISAEERLPEEGQEVLLYDANSIRHYIIGWRRKKSDNNSRWALSNGYVEDKDITHWLPIPSLNPEKEER